MPDSAKPLPNDLNWVREFDPHISDLAGLLAGVKPVIYTDFGEADRPYLTRLCRAFRLKSLMPEDPAGRVGFHHRPGRKMLLLSTDVRALRKASLAWKRSGPLDPEWGALLGYPSCCVQAYLEWQSRRRGLDIIRAIYTRTSPEGPFSFLLNNVFNYFSRLEPGGGSRVAADKRRFRDIQRLNASLTLPTLNVIAWHPCTYRCGESLRKGGKVFAFLEAHAPAFAVKLRLCLGRPVLWLDKYEFAVFRGSVGSNGVLAYKELQPPFSLLPARKLRTLEQGRTLVCKGGQARVDNIVLGAPQRPLLLNFVLGNEPLSTPIGTSGGPSRP